MRWFDLFGRRLSRRDFIRVGRDVAACIALSSLPLPPGTGRRRAIANPFLLGVASGDPLDSSLLIWTRLDGSALPAPGTPASPIEVRWEVAADDQFKRIVRSGAAAAVGDLGHSVHVEVEGLEPAREHWYRFMAGGEASAIGHTRTAPRATDQLDSFRFAFASCQNYEHGYFTAYRHMVSDAPDLIVHLGDYIYERGFGNNLVRRHESDEVFTLEQYRARYSLYRGDADLQAAHAAAPWLVTLDDHEVENNFANDVSEQNAPRDEFLLRRAAAFQAYYEFMPLRRRSLPRGPDMLLYRRHAFGSLVEINVVDTRQYRSDQACGDGTRPLCDAARDATRTLLGGEQEQWLTAGMRASRARWNVIANQIMVSEVARGQPDNPTFPMDQWAGYPAARQRLLQFLAAAPAPNPVVLTGDIHSNWVSDIKADFADPNSPVVGAELVGTSISSGGDGNDNANAATLARNPHLKHYSARRGYVLNTLTPALWTADYRVVPYVTRPGAPVETRARFVIENGKPGVTAA